MSNMSAAMLALAAIFYISSILFGVGVASYLFDKRIKDTLVKYAFAMPIGFAAATFMVLVQEVITGSFNDVFVFVASVVMLAAFALFYLKSKHAQMYRFSVLKKQLASDKVFHILLFIIIAILIVLQIFGVYRNSTGIVGGDNYGTDFLFHLSIGNSLVYTGWPPKLLYANYATNVFPFIADFYVSILTFNGVFPTYALYMMNLPLYFSIAVATIYFLTLITKHRTASAFGFLSFIFCSQGFSMVVLYALHMGVPSLGLTASSIQSMASNPMALLTYPLFNFSDPMASNFAPQHDYVLGWPFTMVILTILYMKFFDSDSRSPKLASKRPDSLMLVAAMMTGLLPLSHPFSMVFVFIFALVAFAYSLLKHGRKNIFLYQWLPFAAIVLAIAIPQILYIKSGDLAPRFISSVLNQPFWQGHTIVGTELLHIQFWFETIGTLLVTGLAGMYFLRKKLIIFLPAFIALALVNFLRFSPSFGDSNKIVMYFLLFMAASTAELYYVLWKRGIAFKLLAVFFFIAIILSGALAEYYDLFSGAYPVASNVELNMSQWALNNTHPNNTFVDSCYNTVFGVTSSLAARRTLMEISMYISLTGIYDYNVGTVDSNIRNFMENPTCSFVQQYNISYVAIENISTFASVWCVPVNRTAFSDSSNFELVKDFGNPGNNITIYKPQCGSR